MEKKKWSDMTVAEHLDAAQAAFEATHPNANGLAQTLIEAQMHASAALALAQTPKRNGRDYAKLGYV